MVKFVHVIAAEIAELGGISPGVDLHVPRSPSLPRFILTSDFGDVRTYTSNGCSFSWVISPKRSANKDRNMGRIVSISIGRGVAAGAFALTSKWSSSANLGAPINASLLLISQASVIRFRSVRLRSVTVPLGDTVMPAG